MATSHRDFQSTFTAPVDDNRVEAHENSEDLYLDSDEWDEILNEKINRYDLSAERQAVNAIDRTFPYSLFKTQRK